MGPSLLLALLLHLCTGDQCLVRLPLDPGSNDSLSCVFPFRYQGRLHSACTVEGHPEGRAWCSTKVGGTGDHVEGGGHWGHCGVGCPVEEGCPQGWLRITTGCYLMDTKVTDL